jgi:hypothetical protein
MAKSNFARRANLIDCRANQGCDRESHVEPPTITATPESYL